MMPASGAIGCSTHNILFHLVFRKHLLSRRQSVSSLLSSFFFFLFFFFISFSEPIRWLCACRHTPQSQSQFLVNACGCAAVCVCVCGPDFCVPDKSNRQNTLDSFQSIKNDKMSIEVVSSGQYTKSNINRVKSKQFINCHCARARFVFNFDLFHYPKPISNAAWKAKLIR